MIYKIYISKLLITNQLFNQLFNQLPNYPINQSPNQLNQPITNYLITDLYASANIFICLTMASNPLERVGDRCSRSPILSMK